MSLVTNHIELKRDMAVTHDEFYRLVRTTISDAELINTDIINYMVDFPFKGGHISISLDEEQTRKLASLSIQHTPMKLIFNNITKNDIDAYLEKFDVSFHKGGG